LHPTQPATGSLLTTDHSRARLVFARELVNWNDDDRAGVLFTDDSRFCLKSSDRHVSI
ncbi:hypothetical protein BDFB_011460, partial [Asbolus verrucosus]